MRVLRTHPFWVHAVRRHRRARGTPAAPDKPSAYDERHDISLLSSRFRSAAVNARYEASRPQEDSAIFFAMHALIFAAITPATGAALWDGFGGERLSAPLLAQLLLFVTAWLVRLGAVVLYWRDAVPRGVCELATFAQVLVRIGVRTAVTIPRAVASEDVGSEFLARLEVAAATLEVAALARYALALPTCAWALLAQPLAPALASLVGYDAADAQLGARGEAGVAAAALLSLPIYLHIEVARRRAWLQGERLAALRQEVRAGALAGARRSASSAARPRRRRGPPRRAAPPAAANSQQRSPAVRPPARRRARPRAALRRRCRTLG